MAHISKISPCLWFDTQAEEAAKLYTSLFKNSKIGKISYYTKEASETPSHKPVGSVLVVEYELDGQTFMNLNGGPIFKFSEAISFSIDCKDQAEVDYFWDNLTADGGEESQCGWLKDKFGVSWQVVPTQLGTYLADPDRTKADRAMAAMLTMKKIDISKIKAAFDGK